MNEIHKRHIAKIPPEYSNPDLQGWKDSIAWCKTQFDTGWWYIGEGVFEFNNKQDHLLFMLRWA